MYVRERTHIHMYIHECIHIHTSFDICEHVYDIHMRVYIYIYIYTERERDIARYTSMKNVPTAITVCYIRQITSSSSSSRGGGKDMSPGGMELQSRSKTLHQGE